MAALAVRPQTAEAPFASGGHWAAPALEPTALQRHRDKPRSRTAAHSNLLRRHRARTREPPKPPSAFKKASLRVHPDKSNHPQAAEAFVRLREAYRVLSDPTLRAAYDVELQALKLQKKLVSSSVEQMAREAAAHSAYQQQLDKEKLRQNIILF